MMGVTLTRTEYFSMIFILPEIYLFSSLYHFVLVVSKVISMYIIMGQFSVKSRLKF